MLASGVTDAPDLLPFAYGLVYTKPETCQQNRDKCARMARAWPAPPRFIREAGRGARDPGKRFGTMDPALLDRSLGSRVQGPRQGHSGDRGGLENSQKVSLEAKLLEPKDALKSYDGLYTDEFVR